MGDNTKVPVLEGCTPSRGAECKQDRGGTRLRAQGAVTPRAGGAGRAGAGAFGAELEGGEALVQLRSFLGREGSSTGKGPQEDPSPEGPGSGAGWDRRRGAAGRSSPCRAGSEDVPRGGSWLEVPLAAENRPRAAGRRPPTSGGGEAARTVGGLATRAGRTFLCAARGDAGGSWLLCLRRFCSASAPGSFLSRPRSRGVGGCGPRGPPVSEPGTPALSHSRGCRRPTGLSSSASRELAEGALVQSLVGPTGKCHSFYCDVRCPQRSPGSLRNEVPGCPQARR